MREVDVDRGAAVETVSLVFAKLSGLPRQREASDRRYTRKGSKKAARNSQSPRIPRNVVAEYDAPHTRLPRPALPHQQHLLLLRLLDLGLHLDRGALVPRLAGGLWGARHVGERVVVPVDARAWFGGSARAVIVIKRRMVMGRGSVAYSSNECGKGLLCLEVSGVWGRSGARYWGASGQAARGRGWRCGGGFLEGAANSRHLLASTTARRSQQTSNNTTQHLERACCSIAQLEANDGITVQRI